LASKPLRVYVWLALLLKILIEKSIWEVLPLLYLCYQHSASLFGFRWKAEDGGIEPPGVALL
jgi:hypothetical protein